MSCELIFIILIIIAVANPSSQPPPGSEVLTSGQTERNPGPGPGPGLDTNLKPPRGEFVSATLIVVTL